MGFLIELAKLKQRGVELSREFSMADSIAELEFEVHRHNNHQTTAHSVAFMKDSLRMIINGLEIANTRFGPFLSIDGWADSVTQDMSKYEHALERLYKRYWRKSQTSPITELAWLLIGSMVAWHFKSKLFGPAQPNNSRAQPPRVSPKPEVPVSKTKSDKQSTTRPLLKAPSGIFG